METIIKKFLRKEQPQSKLPGTYPLPGFQMRWTRDPVAHTSLKGSNPFPGAILKRFFRQFFGLFFAWVFYFTLRFIFVVCLLFWLSVDNG